MLADDVMYENHFRGNFSLSLWLGVDVALHVSLALCVRVSLANVAKWVGERKEKSGTTKRTESERASVRARHGRKVYVSEWTERTAREE